MRRVVRFVRWYRHSRSFGKPVLMSVGYARDATRRDALRRGFERDARDDA